MGSAVALATKTGNRARMEDFMSEEFEETEA